MMTPLPLLPLRHLALLLPFLLTGLLAQAQPDPIKFGKIDPSELTAAPFAGDSAASAVVLCDFGTARIEQVANRFFQTVFERTTRIKILKKSGFDWATVEIVLRGGDRMAGLRGFTYNLINGAVVKEKLESDGRYTEDVTKHVRVRKFTMPNVREGSIIEFNYTVLSEYVAGLPNWEFQHAIPVRWSEYRASYPGWFDFRKQVRGYLPVTLHETSTGSVVIGGITAEMRNFRWAMKDVPSFVAEPFITTSRDYVSRLDFELSSVYIPNNYKYAIDLTWKRFDTNLLEDEEFGRQMDRGGFLKEELAKLPKGQPVPERVAAVHALVQRTVKYNKNEAIYTSASLRKNYQDLHLGNAADVNLLLIAALRTAGLDANPVLLSTRNHGQLHAAMPQLFKFNYVVAHLTLPDGQDLLVDATEPLLPSGTLPERCLNQVGRLILKSPAESRWLDIKPSSRRIHYQLAKLTISPTGAITGTVHEEFGGYSGATVRGELMKLGDKKYHSQFAGKHSRWTVPRLTFDNREALAKPLAVDYEFNQPAEDNASTGQLYLNPFEDFTSLENPFRLESRLYPVDFAMPQDEIMLLTLTLPAGYELAEVPKSAVVDLPEGGGRFLYSVADNGQTVQLTSRMNLNKAVYDADEYEALREFYRLMLAKQAKSW